MPRVFERANSGADDVRMLTIDDLPTFITDQQAHADEIERMYLDGGSQSIFTSPAIPLSSR